MKVKSFKYLKEGTGEAKVYELLILNSTDTHDYGIAMNYLSEEEKKILIEVQTKYEEALKPFMKSYRNFIKNKETPLDQ